MAVDADRHGQVFIAPHLNGGFRAYWENEEPNNDDELPGMLEEAPPFADVEDAVRLGARSRPPGSQARVLRRMRFAEFGSVGRA